MAISPYASPFAAGSLAARRSGDLFVGLRRELDALQRQLATGQRSETFGGLGFERRASLDIRGKLSAIDGYMATVKDAQFRVTLMTLGLSRLTAMGSDTKADLLPPGFDLGTDGRTTPQKNAEERLKLAIDVLNTDANGRYVFAGRASDKRPVVDYKTLMEGDGLRLGLKAMIPERVAADRAIDGLGHVTVGSASAAGVESLTVATADAARLGLKIVGLTETMTNVGLPGSANAQGVTSAAGTTTAALDFTGLPLAGEGFQIEVKLPDGTARSLSFTAVTAPGAGLPGTFEIGTDAATTRDNAMAAVAASITALMAGDDAKTSSAIAAAREFFAQSPGSQLPVGAYSKPVVTWYVGDDDATAVPNGRDTAAARVDDSYVVGTGARANEPPIRDLLVQLGVLAAESFSNTVAEHQRYDMLAGKVRSNLSPADAGGKVESIVGELGSALASMNAAKERHQGTEAVLREALAGNEEQSPRSSPRRSWRSRPGSRRATRRRRSSPGSRSSIISDVVVCRFRPEGGGIRRRGVPRQKGLRARRAKRGIPCCFAPVSPAC
jgi:flagellar hook-associated protein 3 FlgL